MDLNALIHTGMSNNWKIAYLRVVQAASLIGQWAAWATAKMKSFASPRGET